jgi:uncharacterized protein (DUF885 family)
MIRFPALILILPAVALTMTTLSCSRHSSAADFPKLVEDFTYQSLAFSPVSASGQGLHKYKGQDMDRALDDISTTAIATQHQYYTDLQKRLNTFDKQALTPEDQADYDIIDAQIGLALFDLDAVQSWKHSPQSYVELLGSAIYNPFILEYAPLAERFAHIIARMQQIPSFIDTAQQQLSNVPPEWSKVAKEENDGNIALIDGTLRGAVPPTLKGDYDTAARPALESLRDFGKFLTTGVGSRNQGKPDWRLGAERYATKFRLALATNSNVAQVLADAEARLKAVRAEMLELSIPLHAKWFAGHKDHADLQGDERLNVIVREVLDKIAEKHATPATYMDEAKKNLEEAHAFAAAKNLLTLPAGSNLQVIPTPEFERGIYGVGGFNPAPVLEPKLGAFYWITPIPPDWSKERVDSKLREYNFYNLKLLTIHEAMPGHYVQFEFANRVEPQTRRVLRALWGNGPYIEGWAQYITQVMLDEGYLDNSPELRLTLLKQELRVDANAIIDIRLQTGSMTDEDAMEMMEKTTFQEHEEAVAKLQRAKLSSAQLPTYFVGWRDWLRVREAVKQAKGGSFNLHDFHDAALKEGAVPLPALSRLLTGKGL